MIHEVSKQHSIFNRFLQEVRDESIQQDRMRFRRNIERMGEILAYEMSKSLTYRTEEVVTPLGQTSIHVPAEWPVVCSILRAGIPLHQGLLNYFDHADNAFATAYRRYHKGGDMEIEVDYVSTPPLDERVLIIADPMLATGLSIEKVYKSLVRKGAPREVHIVAIIATGTGINHLRAKLPERTTYWVGAVDNELTAQAYIVPGLGDAGDLAYGRKD